MSLTGTAFLVTLLLIAIGATVATLIGWNRVPGPRWRRHAARVGMLIACQASAVLVVAAGVNNSFGFYTSWSDLFGHYDVPAESTAAPVPGTYISTHATVQTAIYRGIASGLTGRVLIWTPPEYDQDQYRDSRFPVIMLLHGSPGGPEDWTKGGGIPDRLAALMAQGVLDPAVVVIPQTDPNNVATDCTDLPGGQHNATWLSHDVPQMIQQHFRVQDSADGWGLAGFSTGGYCAADLALQHPHIFGSAAMFSPDDFAGDPAAVHDPRVRAANNPVTLAGSGAPVSLLVATSVNDRYSSPANANALYRAARWPTEVAPPLILRDGGHNWGTWHAMFPAVFRWLGLHLTPPHQPLPWTVRQPDAKQAGIFAQTLTPPSLTDGTGSIAAPPSQSPEPLLKPATR
ncbi:MAG: hypothetical protein J2P18_16430 [Nocardia sp.]|nr:hypothetical protein [Nocardia sp.]